MKANELRLGNYVNHNIENKAYKVETLSVAPNGDVLVLHGYFPHCTLDFVSPIPLTEEWLIKFGFRKQINEDDVPYYFSNQPMHIGAKRFSGLYENGDCFGLLGNGLNIKYVHQLQNLYFALTGEELV